MEACQLRHNVTHMHPCTAGVMERGGATALNKGSAIVLLHLLGLDSQSHAHGGPNSQQYLDNIRSVDAGVERLVSIVEQAFQDSSTTYILTSDHGCACHSLAKLAAR